MCMVYLLMLANWYRNQKWMRDPTASHRLTSKFTSSRIQWKQIVRRNTETLMLALPVKSACLWYLTYRQIQECGLNCRKVILITGWPRDRQIVETAQTTSKVQSGCETPIIPMKTGIAYFSVLYSLADKRTAKSTSVTGYCIHHRKATSTAFAVNCSVPLCTNRISAQTDFVTGRTRSNQSDFTSLAMNTI